MERANAEPLPFARRVFPCRGYRLHQLNGDRKGSGPVWVSGNTRLTFDPALAGRSKFSRRTRLSYFAALWLIVDHDRLQASKTCRPLLDV